MAYSKTNWTETTPINTTNLQKIEDAIESLDNLTRVEALGLLAMIFKGSVYLKNDQNLFGYTSSGANENLVTLQNNDLVDFGSDNLVTWIRGKGYVSVRAPKLEVQGREVFHAGNGTYHADINIAANQSCPQGVNTKLTNMDSVVSQWPAGAVNTNGGIRIGRTGFYMMFLVARPTSVSNAHSVVRFSVDRNGASNILVGDFIVSSAYGTAFYSASFVDEFQEGDIITPCVNPLNESLTLQSGSKFRMYFLGDNTTS